MKISYAYDAAGNRTKKTVDGVETTYVYDAANRLTSETSGGNTITYGYDPRGNLTSQTEGSDVTSYKWDARNRLTQVTLPDSSSESYGYDAQDRRVSKVNATGTTKYVWDQENLLQEKDGSGNLIAQYTDAPGAWGGLTSQRRGSTSHFYGFDLQGSTRFLSDANGAISDSYEYSAYGEELSATGSTANPFRYDGQWGYYRDSSQRLYVRARHYQPSQGRWMSRDPIGFDGGDWNLYRYVGNSPVNKIDPGGLGGPALPAAAGVIGGFAVREAARRLGMTIVACMRNPACVALARKLAAETAKEIVEAVEDLFPDAKPKKKCKKRPCKEAYPGMRETNNWSGPVGKSSVSSYEAAQKALTAGLKVMKQSGTSAYPDATPGAAENTPCPGNWEGFHYDARKLPSNKKLFGIKCCRTCKDVNGRYSLGWECWANIRID